jgi:hypothetical protein
MRLGGVAARICLAGVAACAALHAQALVAGRVVDDTGAGVGGVRIALRAPDADPVTASSDPAGNFSLALPHEGEYAIRAERLGFFVYQGAAQGFVTGPNQLTITLNHLQEYTERVDVTYSPPAIDPEQVSDHKELDNAEIQAVPFPAPQDYRNGLQLMNGVVMDNAGLPHVNGADVQQTGYTLDGFNISDPVTGRLEARLNIDSIQTIELQTSRFSADNGRGAAGVLNLQTKMGDDRWRFGGTNFIPGVATDGGLHINKWTPRLEVSGPLKRGRAWFHNGFDAFYSADVVHGLPPRQNLTRGISANDLARFQVNVTHSNILTGSFLANVARDTRNGLSILNPVEATNTHRQTLFVSTIRDQQYLNGALLEMGFADTRTGVRDQPQGNELFQITPYGNRGNYFVETNRHAYRQQGIANLFLPTYHWRGEHQFKFGFDLEREAFHQMTLRHPYEVLRDDDSVARYVTFSGGPFEAHKNLEGAAYVQDHWAPVQGLVLEAGLRAEWNEIVRDLELAPRLGAVWAPRWLGTKFSAGWGTYYDAIGLSLVSANQDQVSFATFYPTLGPPIGPVETVFRVNQQSLVAPRFRTASIAAERKLPFDYYLRAEYVRRTGDRGFTFAPVPDSGAAPAVDTYELSNTRRDRYDAVDFTLRHTFAKQFEWFAGYTRSTARTNSAIEYSLENPVFALQAPGPVAWNAPNRFHAWGWLPLPNRRLPERLRFITRNTTAAVLLEYHTGFPFDVVDEQSDMVGPPGSMRLPNYFDINLHFERKFHFLHYLWAWRCGFNNITSHGNPNTVNNVIGTPAFLTSGGGQVRAFSVRLRFLGRK